MITGRCLCGAVRFRTEGGGYMGHCHCSICRKWTGTVFGTSLNVPTGGFSYVAGHNEIAEYQATPEAGPRRHCGICGSTLPGGTTSSPFVGIPAGLLDCDPGLRPIGHVFLASKVPWLDLDDGLPTFERLHSQAPQPSAELGPRSDWTGRAGAARGSCLCGSVRYEVEPVPIRFANCHCGRCRRATGSSYACNLVVEPKHFRWTLGGDSIARFDLPDARSFANAFCRRCGSSLPHRTRSGQEVVVLTGTLDDDPGVRPEEDLFLDDRPLWLTPVERPGSNQAAGASE